MNYAQTFLARRYAQALLRVCGDQFSQDDLKAMQRAAAFFRAHAPALYLLGMPDLSADIKHDIILKLFETVQLPGCFLNLLHLLSDRNRLKLLPDVLTFVLSLHREKHDIIAFTITGSQELPEADVHVIQAFLARTTHKKVQYTYRQDPTLIAGIRAQSDTLLWEHSIRKKLHAIRLSVIR